MSHSIEPAEEQPQQPTTSRSALSLFSRCAAPAALLIAVAALAIAVWTFLADRPAPPTAQQIADAKKRACDTYTTVRAAVSLQTHVEPGADPTQAQAVAANARLSMVAGSYQLQTALDSATPPELADLIRSFAADLQDLTINALAGAADNDSGQVARLQNVQATTTKIVELCK